MATMWQRQTTSVAGAIASERLRVYYAHPMAIYNTPQEKRDVAFLESLGFEVVNPNSPEWERGSLDDYCELAGECDVVAFRGLPDGKITSGVAKEIQAGLFAQRSGFGKGVFELPSGISRRRLTVEQTVETFHELGER